MSEKGKEREPPARQGLLWSDVYEHLGLAGQTSPLAISKTNAVVFSTFSQSSSAVQLGTPQPLLQCYPIDSAAQTASARKTFSIPPPAFPIPHLPATQLSFAPASDYFLAFFPLAPSPSRAASCSTWTWSQPAASEGGTLALWALSGSGGRSPADWKLVESWACPQGEEVVEVIWLGAPRVWVASHTGQDEQSDRPRFSRRARRGPPLLPSQHPTFLVLSASHAVTMYHPPNTPVNSTSSLGASQLIMRTTRCTVDGPGTATWGVMSDANVVGEDDARKKQRRIRRSKFYMRQNDDSIYLAFHSTIVPRSPPSAPMDAAISQKNNITGDLPATGTAEILAGLGINVDMPSLTGNTPGPDPTVDEAGPGGEVEVGSPKEEEPALDSGDEDSIDIVEIRVEFVSEDLSTLSTHPYLSVPLSSASELLPSSIVTHLAFTELPAQDAAQADQRSRPLGLVVVVADLTPGANGEPGRPISELHQWKIDKGSPEASGAADEEATDSAGDETAMYLQSRVLPDSVLTALEPIVGSDSLVLVMEINSQSWTDGQMGSFRTIDLADLQNSTTVTAAPLRAKPLQGHHVPTSFTTTPNSSFVVILGASASSVAFHLHPTLSEIPRDADSQLVSTTLCRLMALALYQGSGVQDLVKVLPLLTASIEGGGKKRKLDEEVSTVEQIIAASWQVLDSSPSPTEERPLSKSRWILLLLQAQLSFYRSFDSPKQQIAREILALAKHNTAFERCCSRVGRTPQYQLDASFRLIKETEAALGTIDKLVLEASIESSWDTWGSKNSQPLPSHFLVSHPTTRSLLISVVKHIQAFCSFFAGVNVPLSAPNLSLPPGSSILVTEMAKGLLADIQRRAALGRSSALSEALEAVRGVMPKTAPIPLQNSTLLNLETTSDTSLCPSDLSKALLALPVNAFDQAALLARIS